MRMVVAWDGIGKIRGGFLYPNNGHQLGVGSWLLGRLDGWLIPNPKLPAVDPLVFLA